MTKYYKLIVTVLFVTAFLFLEAQIPLVSYDEVTVTKNGQPLSNPWAGGFNSPQFSQIDLNNDGIKDLVSFERNFYGAFKTFIFDEWDGFKYAPQYQYNLPNLQNWALLADYDCDGYEDLFTSVPGGIKIFRNNFSIQNGNQFVLETTLLLAEGPSGLSPVYVSPPDLPAIVDVDNDGDLDILSFEILGNYVAFYRNLSMENYGNCDQLEFELASGCWGYFSEDGNNNSITLYDTCDAKAYTHPKSSRHAGSTLLAYDADGDGLKDLAIGDISYNNLNWLSNKGTLTDALVVEVEESFPAGPNPVDITVFPAAFLVDANADGLDDLLVSPNNPNTSENFDNTWYYQNIGTQLVPEFSFVQNNFLQEGMIDAGEGAFAVFFDENADGLQDIFIGNFGYYIEAGIYSSQLALIRNTGTPEAPEFEFETDDYESFSAFGLNGIYPSFGDMDGDGDADMIVGDEDGLLHYFRNDAGAGNPVDFTLSQANYQGIDVGESAKPFVVDVNRDELPDLLVGERSGTINYFENTGSATTPVYTALPTNELFGGIDVMPECCTGFSAPTMIEDSLGNYNLYVGSESGKVYLFNNIENNISGTFNLVDSLYLHAFNVNPSAADINNDGKPEFVVGEYTGGLMLYKNGNPPGLGIDDQLTFKNNIEVYPNPASNQLFISIENQNSISEITLFDMFGKMVQSKKPHFQHDAYLLDVSGISPGFYFVQVSDGELSVIRKVVVR